MSTVAENKGVRQIIRSCSFLVEDHPLDTVFIPEEFTEDERMIGNTAREFVEGRVVPNSERLESLDLDFLRQLATEAGELGLFGVDVPEAWGGFEQSKAVSMLVAESIARSGSFQVLHACQTGIGTLPLVYFGTRDQKDRYLEKLATGTWVSAYALTEAGSGSDALAAKTRAVPAADGSHYVLNGEKMFITNAGIADLFTVFAQVVDGDDLKFTAFLIERTQDGVGVGAEEKKMGFKGSSTRALILQDVRVPRENVLGEIGRGHVIAFNILNVGRFKLAAGSVGGGIDSIVHAARYAKQRHQFGRPIADFGMIRHKIGEAAARCFAARSMVYRTAGYIDQNIATLDHDDPEYFRKVIEIGIQEYAVECSMMKVFGTEVLDFCVDQAVQIHGGYGYIAEYSAERHYRDSRINRIWEGTNEINRLVMLGELMKKAMKGDLPLFARAKALLDELMGFPALDEDGDDAFLAEERRLVTRAKKAVLLAVGTAAQERGKKLREDQEVLGFLADMMIDAYGMESCVLRTAKLADRGDDERTRAAALFTRLFCFEAIKRIEMAARDVLAAVCQGDTLQMTLAGLRRTVKHAPADTVALRRQAAGLVLDAEAWPLA